MQRLSREIARYILPMAEFPPDEPMHDDAVPGWDGVRELHPLVLASRRASGDALLVIDVREPWEWELVRLDGSTHLPLSSFAREATGLDPSREIVLYCHHGVRSRSAANYLSRLGFRRLWNLSGGIERYAQEADPSLPRY